MQLALSGVFGSTLNSCTSTLTASTWPLLTAWCSAVQLPYNHRCKASDELHRIYTCSESDQEFVYGTQCTFDNL